MLATRLESRSGPDASSRLEVAIVQDGLLVRAAQALRWRILAEALGRPPSAAGYELDHDWYDRHCEHLVVRDLRRERVVGTCRLLPSAAAARLGGYSADDLFDLEMLDMLRLRMVEMGKLCVHPAYRGRIEPLMWGAIGRYLLERGDDYVLGCVSLAVDDGGHVAASAYRGAMESSASPDDLRVRPRRPLPLEHLSVAPTPKVPPALGSWLANGAWVCGEPAWDRGIVSASLPLLLPLARMRIKSLKPFLDEAA